MSIGIQDESWEVNESIEEIEILDPIVGSGHISEDSSDMSEEGYQLELVGVSGDEGDTNISEDHQEQIRSNKRRGRSANPVPVESKSKKSRSQVGEIDETDSSTTTSTQQSTPSPQEEVVPSNIPSTEELLNQIANLTNENTQLKTASQQTEQKYESLVTNLQSKVECPVCYETPKQPPVYVCHNGHLVCQSCRRDSCPTCRVKMVGATSLLALTVIQNIPHSCEFQVHGCSVRCEINDLPSHQSVCQYRTVKCPNFSCSDKVPLHSLAEHVLKRCIYNGTFYSSPLVNSYNYIVPANQTVNKRPNSTWRPDGISFDGQNFFLKITRKGKKGMWYFYIQMAGSEAECKNYNVTLFVFNTNLGSDGKYSHRFIGDICPVDISSTERAAEAGYCQSLTDNQMNKLFSEITTRGTDMKFGFSVEVRIEKETPTDNAPNSVENPVQDALDNQGGEEEAVDGPSGRDETREEHKREEVRRESNNVQVRQRNNGFRIMRRNQTVSRRSDVLFSELSGPVRHPSRQSEAGEGPSSTSGGRVGGSPVRHVRHRVVLRTMESSDEEEETPVIGGVLMAN